MKTMTTQALSMPEKNYIILDSLSVSVQIDHNPYLIAPDSVFALAARNNPKRSYLFVSKLIGKHIPVQPQVPFLTGYLLASRLAESLGLPAANEKIAAAVNIITGKKEDDFLKPVYKLPGKTLFLGFAETATALGYTVFDCFKGDLNYIHTTRENLEGAYDTIYFSEDHCHAPEQKCLVFNPDIFKDNELLVIVDDEITTGNLCLNLIKALHKKYPQKNYAVLSILDWRSAEAKSKYCRIERELGVTIRVLSLLSGSFTATGNAPVADFPASFSDTFLPPVNCFSEPLGPQITIEDQSFLRYTGRFGITVKETGQLKEAAEKIGYKLAATRKGKKSLCLGTGEFMYLPFLIASRMGEGVYVQSTTRSPVHPCRQQEYAVKQAISFNDPFRPEIRNFVYNIPANYYDEIYIFWEREVKPEQVYPLVAALIKLGISKINFVSHCS